MRKISQNFLLFLILLISSAGTIFADKQVQEKDEYISERIKMVEGQIIKRGIKDNKVIAAMIKVKRHLFVPFYMRPFAYMDRPLPIGYGQTISQPFIVAFMTEAVRLQKNDKVLEIGTGSGYQAAILAELVDEVFSIEIIKVLAERADKTLKDQGYENITVIYGDGYLGLEDQAPFDAIIVTAAPDEIPQKLIEQLKIGGRMVIPVGTSYQELLLITKTESGTEKKNLLPVSFVPMVHDQ